MKRQSRTYNLCIHFSKKTQKKLVIMKLKYSAHVCVCRFHFLSPEHIYITFCVEAN